jgi:hypothetical protein
MLSFLNSKKSERPVMHNNNEKISDEAPNPSYMNIWLISAPVFFNIFLESIFLSKILLILL